MTQINRLIRYISECDLGRTVYDAAFPVIIVALLCYMWFHRKKYDIPLVKALAIVGILILATPRVSWLAAWIEYGFRAPEGGNVIRAFAFMPLVFLLTAKILRLPFALVVDFTAPMMLIWNIIGQSVCPFLGCCRGISCSWGIWNPLTDSILVPVQWMICLAGVAILVFLLWYEKKHLYCAQGKLYPILLVSWGGARFLLEYLRDNEKIIMGLSRYALYALFMVLVGMVWLFTIEEIQLENKRKSDQNNRKS